jgi:lipopolysaccharide transport system permease protein
MAQANVFFRDMVHIWHVVSRAWMYLSAVFYPVSRLPDRIFYLVTHYNPMYFYMVMFRNYTIGSETHMGELDLVLRGAIAAVVMLLVGLVCFSRNKNKFILYM